MLTESQEIEVKLRGEAVARDLGDRVYRNTMNDHICDNFYISDPFCEYFQKPEVFVELRYISSRSGNTGDCILGDLDKLGWLVLRGLRTNSEQVLI